MKTVIYNEIDEIKHIVTLDNGLEIHIIPKKNTNKTFVGLNVNYGALHTTFKAYNKVYKLPNGVAHFLEHVHFISNGVDAMNLFEDLSLTCNAQTSSIATSYYFYGRRNIYKGLEILLKTLFTFNITLDTVNKERNIIKQEILQVKNDVYERIYSKIINKTYETYPIIYDILGSCEELNEIDLDMLNLVHNIFYHPSNCKLVITGKVCVNEITKVINDIFESIQINTKVTYQIILPSENIKKEQEEILFEDVFSPKLVLSMGFKINEDKNKTNYIMNTFEIFDIINYYLFSSSNLFYQNLLDKRYIISKIDFILYIDYNIAYQYTLCETTKTKELKKSILDRINRLDKVSLMSFERLKRKKINKLLSLYSNCEYFGYEYLQGLSENSNILDKYNFLNDLTIDDVNKYIDVYKKSIINTIIINSAE